MSMVKSTNIVIYYGVSRMSLNYSILVVDFEAQEKKKIKIFLTTGKKTQMHNLAMVK